MAKTFLFYDLETSGLSARHQRIMQFGGQRTDLDLKPIGEPFNILVRLSSDILPEPGAVLITGITPQKTLEEGISEPDFARILHEEVFTPDTCAVGFNNIRFDDEFIRHALWRNFYDPYQWAWSENRSRWDMLDVVRMTRALRPDGIEWPFDSDGAPTNRLELLTKVNQLDHFDAHDALSDVHATIAVARLIKQKQPKLFAYLLGVCGKKEVARLVDLKNPKPFVYSSGRYGKTHLFTTVAYPIATGSRPGSVALYDLRHDPRQFDKLSHKELSTRLFASWQDKKAEGFQPIPVKELAFNKCPAVAPLGVLDKSAQKRLKIDLKQIEANRRALTSQFAAKIAEAYAGREAYQSDQDVEGQLYDGFGDDKDKARLEIVRNADQKTLKDFEPKFVDQRLPELLLRYKARWLPKALSSDEQTKWQDYVNKKFQAQAPAYVQNLQNLSARNQTDQKAQFLLEELRLWLEANTPLE